MSHLRAFTVCISRDVYLASKTFAAATETTLGNLVQTALQAYLADHDEGRLTSLLAEVREKLSETGDPERGPRPRVPRLPLAPLLELCANKSALARELGVNRGQVSAWDRRGIPLDEADGLAVALGRHPAELWPDWNELSEEWERSRCA